MTGLVRWRFDSTDTATGRRHLLTIEGVSADDVAGDLGEFGFRVESGERCDWQGPVPKRRDAIVYMPPDSMHEQGRWVETGREGGLVGIDDAKNLHRRLPLADRHFLLQSLAESGRPDAETFAWQWMIEGADLLAAVSLTPAPGGVLRWSPPRIVAPRRLCIILHKLGDFCRVLDVVRYCEAINIKTEDRDDLLKRANRASKAMASAKDGGTE